MTTPDATPPGRPTVHRLLVVDFDYFFPNPMQAGDLTDPTAPLYDWGHAESRLFRDLLWPQRAAGFHMWNLPLPRCLEHTSDRAVGYRDFWPRFTITPGTPLWIADSNSHAGPLTAVHGGRFDEVWLFDAHHDAGYAQTYHQYQTTGVHTCEDWLYRHHAAGTRIVMRYPTWRPWPNTAEPPPRIPLDRGPDNGQPIPATFDAVFACRSGSWVPAWCDDQWWDFVRAYPAGGLVEIEPDVFDTPRWTDQIAHGARRTAAAYRRSVERTTRPAPD